jgi:hypothetical protein
LASYFVLFFKMNNNPNKNLYLLFFSAFLLFAFSLFHVHWGYDEYGAIISHIELNNKIFIHQYIDIILSVCNICSTLVPSIEYVLLPLFIVPIRWTYALGVSPWLELARWLPFDWPILKPILVLPNVILATLGLHLINQTLRKFEAGFLSRFVFCALLFSSAPFVYWVGTLTSYSNHIICFGLILFSSFVVDDRERQLILGRPALMRAVVALLNYQWIIVLVFIGVVDLFRNFKIFFSSGRWRGWIISAVISFLTLLFLILRTRFSGKHGSPTTTALTNEQILLYDFPHNATNILDALKMLASRYIEILASFYVKPDGDYLVLSGGASILILLSFFLFMVLAWRSIDNHLYAVLLAIIFSTVALHLSGVMPMSPLRHQLVLLPPLCLLVACTLDRICVTNASRKLLMFLAIVASTISLAHQLNGYLRSSSSMQINEFRDILNERGVQRLVLAPCDLEPMLYPDLRERYKPIYRCGPKVLERLPDDVDVIAVWSSFQPLTEHHASLIIKDFGDSDWLFRGVLKFGPGDRQVYSLMVGHKAIKFH